MGSNAFISFIAGVAFATWVFTKSQRRTGNNTQSSAILSVISGVVAFIVTEVLLKAVLN